MSHYYTIRQAHAMILGPYLGRDRDLLLVLEQEATRCVLIKRLFTSLVSNRAFIYS
jgi:hypothetical protein